MDKLNTLRIIRTTRPQAPVAPTPARPATHPAALKISAPRRPAVRLLAHKRGVVALEFAILAIPFFVFVLGIMEVAYDMFVQEALDNAMEMAARQVQVGRAQGISGETSQQIVAAVCPNLGQMLSCGQMVVAVVAIPTDYYTTPISSLVNYSQASGAKGGHVCTGQAGQMMGLAGWYNGPSFLGTLIPGFAISDGKGGLIHQTFASVGFVDEYFSGGQSC